MTSYSLTDLSRCLRELQTRPNLFEHGLPVRSHERVLIYSLKSFTATSRERRSSTAEFGAELIRRCFPRHSPPPRPGEVTVEHREADGSTGRSVFGLTVSRDDSSHQALLTVGRRSLVDQEGARDHFSASDDVPIVLYAVPPLPDPPEHKSVQLLGHDAIHNALTKADRTGHPTWLLDEYREWFDRLRCRRELFRRPAFQHWYFTGTLPANTPSLSTTHWPAPPQGRSHVHRHFLHRLAHTLDGVDPNDEILPKLEPGTPRNPAQVQLRVASLDDGSVCYRFHCINSSQAALDLRFCAGPKRGIDRSDKKHWISLKKTIRAHLREGLVDAGLDEWVDLPGYRAYPFQKAARDTSLGRVWLPTRDDTDPPSEPVSPRALADRFPDLHEVVTSVLQQNDKVRPHLAEWVLPR